MRRACATRGSNARSNAREQRAEYAREQRAESGCRGHGAGGMARLQRALLLERSMRVASLPCVRANWTTSPMPLHVRSFPAPRRAPRVTGSPLSFSLSPFLTQGHGEREEGVGEGGEGRARASQLRKISSRALSVRTRPSRVRAGHRHACATRATRTAARIAAVCKHSAPPSEKLYSTARPSAFAYGAGASCLRHESLGLVRSATTRPSTRSQSAAVRRMRNPACLTEHLAAPTII
eukprot:6196165-Pleurochrysis_carterae.AAC.1